ncbi:hypothetical protein SeLEV6574_g05302 [Synchytrium endobioticum]|uniref:BZIP domain-containing protein n=1 Tax=Synchytrium endobioticum TaxID=286115 RepID=A0A507CUY7_9FUNG|nr:hypothetical protein SeLEV6574_g05302 [Synchytrium endobioticum]
MAPLPPHDPPFAMRLADDEPCDKKAKRAAQNREAQRSFRERKAKYVAELEAKVKILEARADQSDHIDKRLKDIPILIDRLARERDVRNREQLLWCQERDELSGIVDTLTRDCIGLRQENISLKHAIRSVLLNSSSNSISSSSSSSSSNSSSSSSSSSSSNSSSSNSNSSNSSSALVQECVKSALDRSNISSITLSLIQPTHPILLSPQATANLPSDMQTRRNLFDSSRATLFSTLPPLLLNCDILNGPGFIPSIVDMAGNNDPSPLPEPTTHGNMLLSMGDHARANTMHNALPQHASSSRQPTGHTSYINTTHL